jgi:hypothetical protein
VAIDDTLLAKWLSDTATEAGFLKKVPFEVGPDISEYANADTAGCVTPVGGFGLANEGIFDQPQFQVRIRAREHQLQALKQTMDYIDRKLILEVSHMALWDTWVVVAGRSGSGPVPLQEDTRERRSYVCTYFAQVEL